MAIYHKIELSEEDITEAYFDAVDLKRTFMVQTNIKGYTEERITQILLGI